MDADGIVGVLVGILGVHTLGNGSERVGQTGVLLHLCTLLGGELALTGDVFESLVDVYIACCLIEQRTTGVELGLHARQHVIYGGEVDNLLTELGTLLGVGKTLVVSLLLYTYRLGGDTETGTVHQRHHILDKTHTGAAAELSLGILVHELTSR